MKKKKAKQGGGGVFLISAFFHFSVSFVWFPLLFFPSGLLCSCFSASRAGARKSQESNYCGMQERAGDAGRAGWLRLPLRFPHEDPSLSSFLFLFFSFAGRAGWLAGTAAAAAASECRSTRREPACRAGSLLVYTGPLFERTAARRLSPAISLSSCASRPSFMPRVPPAQSSPAARLALDAAGSCARAESGPAARLGREGG